VPIKWHKIEEKWQKAWEEAKIFEADPDPDKPKYFVTVAYPYPNSPQHIGHGRTYTLADVHARYMRMRGFNVLFPMAFHYTGTPVLAMSKRVKAGDADLINTFVRIYKVPQEVLKEFVEPIKIARYFHEEIRASMKKVGYSIDWRRDFTTIDPQYNRFIEWQFKKLREAGFISQGSHPVGWCPSCGNPVGQHDTLGDVEPEIEEFTIIKFEYNGCFLPAATLRPETIFGVTNVWLNPEVEYVNAKVENEQWIVSKESVEKLRYLNRKVEIKETFLGKELVGKKVSNPVATGEILILPAAFVNPNNATGVVMSVPGHAPYDYVALNDMKREASHLKQYGITPEALDALKPISIIAVPKHSLYPAADVVKEMGIKSQMDPSLEKATKEVYRHEFHNGRMKENTKEYAGLPVAEAKQRVKADLVKEKKADIMYELVNKPVICRCGTECIVKVFEDQWFINYGEPRWKATAHRAFENMEILPQELIPEFNYVIDWLHEKACARKAGLGTKLPWDPEWIIESLSDSVIYMAYYIIVKHIKDQGIKANQLTDSVFDYVFLGVGQASKVAREASLNPEALEQMRSEFSYFYPLDSRHSGRDLVPNHLTFMIFIHTAIFPEALWPRQIVVNGSVLMDGRKMSKSFGNIIPLREAIKLFGADPLRFAVLATSELLQDADFSSNLARSVRDRLERFYRFAVENAQTRRDFPDGSPTLIDKWMLSRLQEHIRMATEAMDKLMVRKAIHSALYALDQDFQWYLRRTGGQEEASKRRGSVAEVVKEILDAQVKMLAPIAPHICEEVWEKTGGKGFVSLADWPVHEEAKVDTRAEEGEALIRSVLEDTLNIIRATGITPKRINYYVAAPWKWKIYLMSLKKSLSMRINFSEFMKELMANTDLKRMAKKVSRFASQIVDEVNQMPDDKKNLQLKIGSVDELETLIEAESFFQKELNAKIHVYSEEAPQRHDPKKKAELSRPCRPAIYIE